jgi:phenylalanyl-tRNA synthetase beta chain
MKLPMSWLREWLELDASAEQVAEALTTRGFYVEDIETHGRRYPGIVVARVIEAARHPNADKLSLCRVDGGAGELKIVCGAPNVRSGMLVALAKVGTTMPNGLVIRKAKIRGEESQGMLCSARELMLSDEHEGILDLGEFLKGATLEPGKPLDAHLPEPDSVLEVEIPFNRPDGMGVLGLAREVKAALGGRWSEWARARLAARPASAPARVTFDLEVEDPTECPGYLAQLVEGVRVGPSPAWLVHKLAAMGQRSINNLVDLTNLVLFEFAQPLHAFDAAKLEGGAIRVRRAKPGEKLTTLDGKARELTPEVLIIADRSKPVALAGLMGGADSEVTEATTSILLECATFQPARVRRGARALDLATEASKRYERGVDPRIGPAAAARFLTLLLELNAGARLGPWRRRHVEPQPRLVTLRPARCERLIGLPFGAGRCADLLESLEFGVQRGDALSVTVPTWRPDCTLEDDLVEEVARANGYDRIPEAPLETGGAYATRGPRERVERRAREAMLALGFHEALCSTLVSEPEALAAAGLLGAGPARLVRLSNPMSREGEVLRPNLVPGLLRATAHNLRQGAAGVRLFEVGAGFLAAGGPLPEERTMLAAVLAGPRFRHAHDPSPAGPAGAYDPRRSVDFLDAKGLWETWLGQMRVDSPEWRAYAAGGWKSGASAEVAVGTSCIAWAGRLAQDLLRTWDIEADVHLFVALLEPLADGASAVIRARAPGRFPPVRRDVAFFVPRGTTHASVERALAGSAGEWLRSIELFDVYEGPGTPAGMKSLAFALEFQNAERTLTEAEVGELQSRMVTAVAQGCGGQLRERT